MELNTHTEHEHASMSLKVILLIFAVVVVGALGYLVWNQNSASDTTDNSGAVVKKTTSTTTKTATADNTVACGDKAYAYSLTFDAIIWKSHKVKETVPAGGEAIIYCYFNMPTTDSFWATASSTNLAGYVSIFAVGVYTPAQWATAIAQPAEVPTELGHNASYYWGWSPAQAYPDTFKATAADVKNVVATFKINP